MWLGRGNLYVEAGTLRFRTAGGGELDAGDYSIPYQMVSSLLLEPGTACTHDALRILARHGTSLLFVGEDGVRFYASLPRGPDSSQLARRQVEAWADPESRHRVVRQMYTWRLGELPAVTDLNALRGIEGARVKESYRRLAEEYGLQWSGRRYDRSRPEDADVTNQAINHASSALQGAALTAVAATGTIPQLGFIHEDSSQAFALDVADLYREEILLPVAFGAAREILRDKKGPIETLVRKRAGRTFRSAALIPAMIDRIKELLDGDDHRGDA